MNGDAPSDPAPAQGSETAAAHPEEMKAAVELRVGKCFSITATARATPASLVAAALLISAIVIPLAWVAKGRAREPARASYSTFGSD